MEAMVWNPETSKGITGTSAMSQMTTDVPSFLEGGPEEPVGVLETAGAFFRQETVLGSAMAYGLLPEDKYGDFEPQQGFNPYAYFFANEDKFGDLKGFLQRGDFENVTSQLQFEMRAARLRDELKDRETVAQAEGWGLALGTAASVADLDMLVPYFGWVSKGTRLAKMAKGAAYGGAVVAAQEAGLHMAQDARTLSESLQNVGLASALGGAIGIFAPAADKANVLHKDHPNNPLKVENDIPVGTWTPGETLSESAKRAAADYEHLKVGGSVGAAKANVIKDLEEGRRGWFGKWAEKGARKWAMSPLGTPMSRAYRWTADSAREVSAKLMDLGGRMNASNVYGKSTGLTAEDYKELIQKDYESLTQQHVDAVRRIREAMGGSQSKVVQALKADANDAVRFVKGPDAGKTFNLLEEHEFERLTLLALMDVGDDVLKKEAEQFGEHADMIIAEARQQAERIHEVNQKLEDQMVDAGMISDKDRMGREYRLAQLWDSQTISSKVEEFREYLYGVLGKEPDEDWLKENYGMSLDEFRKLGDSQKSDVIPDPVGYKNEIMAEWLGDSEAQALAQAQLKAARYKRVAEDSKRLLLDTIAAVKELTREIQKADLKSAKAAIRKKHLEKQKLQSELESVRIAEKELVLAAEGARQKTLERLLSDSPKAERLGHELTPSAAQGRIQGRLHELARQRRVLERKLQKLEPQLQKLDEALKEAEATAKAAREARKEYNSLKARLRKDARDMAKKADRAAKKAARLEKRPGMYEVVDQIVENLTRGQHYAIGYLDEAHLAPSGRSKRRKLRLTPEQRLKAMELGFQRRDLYQVMHRSFNDVGGRLGLRKVFGEELSDIEKSEVYRKVRDEYEALKRQANDSKVRAYLDDELKVFEKDLKGLRDRLVGVAGIPADPNSLAVWFGRTARTFNFVKYGAGFLLTSLTDLANMVLTNGFKEVFTKKYVDQVSKILKETDKNEVARWVVAAERLQHSSRSAKVTQLEDLALTAGVGTPGTLKHTITSKAERVLRAMSDRVNLISGLAWWNTRLKAMTMVIQQDKLIRMVQSGEYEELLQKAHLGDKEAQSTIGQLATLGIDEDSVRSLRRVLEKAGPIDDDGVLRFDIEKMTELGDEGSEAVDLVFSALHRAASRAVMTPGIGDTPLLMDHAFFKVLMQFQTFGFVAVNRMIGPMGQRIRTLEDMEAYLSMAMALGLGSFIVAAKDYVNYGTVRERNLAEWTYDAIDRSGMMAWMTPYLGLSRRLLGIGGTSSRFSNVNSLGMMMGPSFGTAADIMDVTSTASDVVTGDADLDKLGAKLERLLPYQFYWRAFKQFTD